VTYALLALALAAAPAAPPPGAKPAKPAAPAPRTYPGAVNTPAPPPGTSSVPKEGRTVLNRVAAILNGEVVTMRDLEERSGEELRRAQAAPASERDQAVRRALRRAWDNLLAERLFRAQAVTLQLEVNEGQVDGAIEDIKTRNRFDDNQLDLALAAQGLDRAGFKAQIRRELESMQVLNYQVRSKVKVTDEDLKNYYQTHPGAFGGEEELHVRHLFLPLAADAAPAAVEAAQGQGERLLKRALGGEDFAALVREVAKGSDGDLGWLKRGQIQKQLEEAYLALADGQVSKLVRAGPGLHLFKVEGRRRAGGKTFEQAKDEIRETLTQEQTGSYREQYLAELKKDAVIELRAPELLND
jgi:peptidyl-prolyl cis-trans isomerase SurA